MTISIAELNRFPREERNRIYLQLIPPSIFEKFNIDQKTLKNPFGEHAVTGFFPEDENLGCIEVRYRKGDSDCIFSCQVSLDAFMQSLHLDFIIINDPFSERFNIDIDQEGKNTFFGTRTRNIPEEIRAMEAGLAPGMVRRGLRITGEFSKCLEKFMESLEIKTVTIGAFFYHNSILWERYGFRYFKGRVLMEKINKEFQPGGVLFNKMDNSSPFRRIGMEKTVRGRSWAIHDGVYFDAFGEEWECPIMYKTLGEKYYINTFPDQIY